MAILGYNTKGASNRAFAAGRMIVAKFTLASAGTLTELHGWVLGGSGQAVRIVVYDDDGASAGPGTRLAYSASFSTPSAIDYEAVETGLSVALAAGDYWIGCIGQAAIGGFYYDSIGTSQEINSGATYTPPPNPFGGTPVAGTRQVSCWAVYTAGPATTTARFSRLKLGTGLTGTDLGSGVIKVDASAAVAVKEDGTVAGTRGGINFHEAAPVTNTYASVKATYATYATLKASSRVTIALADDAANNEVDVTIGVT